MDKTGPVKVCLYINSHRLGVLKRFNAQHPLIKRRARVEGGHAYVVEESTVPGIVYRLIDAWEEEQRQLAPPKQL